jgi:hypothetical protein
MQNEEKGSEQETAASTDDTWEADQKDRSYYYDDAHGYEVYDPESDESDEDS